MTGRYYTGAPVPYSDFTKRREEHEVDAARQQAEAERLNEEAKAAWAARLQADRDAQAQAAEAALLAMVEPQKAQERRRWLVDHPHEDGATFDARAWPQLRRSLLEALKQDRQTAQEQALRRGAGGVRYSF